MAQEAHNPWQLLIFQIRRQTVLRILLTTLRGPMIVERVYGELLTCQDAPQGDKGQKGEKGQKGQTGEVGQKGQKGQTGNTGNTGSTGAERPKRGSR